MNNNTKLSLSDIADQILAGNMDFSAYSAEQQKELIEAAQHFTEQIKQNDEYLSDVPDQKALAKAKEENRKVLETQQIHDASHLGTTILADSAFVADGSPSSSLENRGEKVQDKLHYDDDDPLELTSEDDDDDQLLEINEYSAEAPKNGEHKRCVLVEYPQKIAGKNGNSDYRIFRIRDLDDKIEWRKFVSEENLKEVFSDLNYENKKILTSGGKKSTKDYFNCLMTTPFRCWTVQNLSDKTCTYFKLDGKGGYKGFVYYLGKQREEKEVQGEIYDEKKRAGTQQFFPSPEQTAKPWEF